MNPYIFQINAPSKEIFDPIKSSYNNKYGSRFYQFISPSRPMTSDEIKQAFAEDLKKKEKIKAIKSTAEIFE
jgi:hypothetical protein